MIIVRTPSNSNQKSIAFATAIRRDYVCQIILDPPQPVDFTYCRYETVKYNKVFAQVDDAKTDFDKNDVSTFLVSVASGDITVFKLKKDSAIISEDCVNYGTNSSWENTQTLFGLQLEWKKVIKDKGVGIYTVEAHTGSDEDSLEVLWSEDFKLAEFDEMDADGTFVIESVANGRIDNGYDFTGIITPNYWDLPHETGFYWRYRIEGSFGGLKPKLIRTEYQDAGRNILQIQDKIQNEYTLQTWLIYWSLCKRLIESAVHNSVYMTDFNLFNPLLQDLKRKSIVFTDFNDVTYINHNRRQAISIKATDRTDNTIKRN